MNAGKVKIFAVACLLLLQAVGFVSAQNDENEVGDGDSGQGEPEATTASGAAATGGGGDSNGDNDDAAPSPTQSSAGDDAENGQAQSNQPDPPGLSDECQADDDCSALDNTRCIDDGANQGTTRCACQPGYVTYVGLSNRTGVEKDDYLCGEIIQAPHGDGSICGECESNEGICHHPSANDLIPDHSNNSTELCKCPVARTGDKCEDIRVNVTCGGDTDKLEMKICFKPNENVDFSDGWKMFAEDQSDHDECVAHTVDDQHPETTWCDDGMQALAINMNPTNGAENGAKCGTEMSEASMSRTYSNTIVVVNATDRDMHGSSPRNSIAFKVFCTYKSYDQQSFKGMSVYWLNGNHKGEVVNPFISSSILNRYDEELPLGVKVKVNDPLRFRITLNITEGTYKELSVQFCTASTSPVVPDRLAETLPLISHGCPVLRNGANGQSSPWYFTHYENDDDKLYIVHTGYVPAFKLYSSNTVFVHCSLKLCLVGERCPLKDEAACSEASEDTNGASRRKRSIEAEYRDAFWPAAELDRSVRSRRSTDASSGTYTVSSHFTVYESAKPADQTESDTGGGISAGMTAFVVILILFIIVVIAAVAAVAYLKLKRRKQMRDAAREPQAMAMQQTYTRF